MVFSSALFLVYFLPLVLLLYHFCAPRYKNALLLIVSVIFYAWGAPRFVFVILFTTFVDFFLVRLMHRSAEVRQKKLFLILSLLLNLGLLFFFKYFGFFVEEVNGLLVQAGIEPVPLIKIILPIGISFYTFESVTYVVDVFRGVHKPLDSFWKYQLYILFFPKLIAGPIVRYHEIADQFDQRPDDSVGKINGFIRFCIGLAKKVLLANSMALYADEVFGLPAEKISTIAAWAGVLAYTFQIYFDFSGYSDMAIGLARMFGFRLPENFDNPYISGSITEFWRRWHITLGRWMKNYLYIPLGGNRSDKAWRVYFNLWLVFIASGLWHGAGYTFLIWGLYHGFFLVIERAFLLRLYNKLPRIIPVFFTFFLVILGWMIFRAETLEQAGILLNRMFVFESEPLYTSGSAHFFFYLSLCVLFSFWNFLPAAPKVQYSFFSGSEISSVLFRRAILACLLLTVSLANISSGGFNPFIYFRF